MRSLDSDPVNAAMIYAGTDIGLCRSHDAGSNWELVDSPFSGQTVWKVAVDPLKIPIEFWWERELHRGPICGEALTPDAVGRAQTSTYLSSAAECIAHDFLPWLTTPMIRSGCGLGWKRAASF